MAYKAYLLAQAIKMMALPKLPVLISQSGMLGARELMKLSRSAQGHSNDLATKKLKSR